MFMAKARSTTAAFRRWLPCLAAFAQLAWSAYGQYDPDWTRHFRIGAVVGLNIKADFRTTRGTVPLTHPAGVYDDGYVHPSQNVNGLTGYWGYDNASQQNTPNSLLMHDTTSFTSAGSTTSDSGSAFPGFELAYGGNLWYWGRARIGWEFGFGLLPISITVNESTPGTYDQSVYSFGVPNDQNGNPVVLPNAPYHGGPSGQGAQINDTGTKIGTTNSIPGAVTGHQTLDVILYTLRLGPSVYWDINRHVGVSLGAGPALGIVSGDLKYDETIGSFHGKGQVSGTEVVYGGYVNAAVMYHAVRNGDIYLSAQYMPLGDATISGQGHQGTLKLGGGVYVSAGINWPF
jgi:hypothetical protein